MLSLIRNCWEKVEIGSCEVKAEHLSSAGSPLTDHVRSLYSCSFLLQRPSGFCRDLSPSCRSSEDSTQQRRILINKLRWVGFFCSEMAVGLMETSVCPHNPLRPSGSDSRRVLSPSSVTRNKGNLSSLLSPPPFRDKSPNPFLRYVGNGESCQWKRGPIRTTIEITRLTVTGNRVPIYAKLRTWTPHGESQLSPHSHFSDVLMTARVKAPRISISHKLKSGLDNLKLYSTNMRILEIP